MKGYNDQRPRWEGCFSIKPGDLRLICDTPNAILACVLFLDTCGQLSRARTAYAWWMSSEMVRRLRGSGHFIETKTSKTLELWVHYAEPAPGGRYAQNTHISLFKQHQGKDAVPGDRSRGELLGVECFDFGGLRAG